MLESIQVVAADFYKIWWVVLGVGVVASPLAIFAMLLDIGINRRHWHDWREEPPVYVIILMIIGVTAVVLFLVQAIVTLFHWWFLKPLFS